MQRYSRSAKDHFFNPRNVGDLAGGVAGSAASLACGAVVRISLSVDQAQRIMEARFRAAGCGSLVATSSFLTELIRGRTTGEAAALAQTPETVVRELEGLPVDKEGCGALACQALISAITSFSDAERACWEGEDPLICTCFCVSERTIEREVQQRKLRTIAEVTGACNAGGGCRSCYPLIQDILDDCWRQAEADLP